ncbi:hypothetical protein SDC9_210296 [bioreactor metagenome]|uniref:Uncharacterized protein n=1 Tax=bioreactor metagenome TaxID=1076179 RepID=A0A645JGR9_9ZZZZ
MDVLGVLTLDKHIGKTDGIGLRVNLLPEKAHFGIGVHSRYSVISGRKHAAGTASHIQHSGDAALSIKVVQSFRKQNADE